MPDVSCASDSAGRFDPRAYRDRFPILRDTTYLVNHSLGAMPSEVGPRLAEFTKQWATRGVQAWGDGWWDLPVTVGNLLGRIMNAPEGSVAMHQNVSIIQALVASALDFGGPRNKVVYTDQNFPSCMYVWESYVSQGARVVSVPSEADGSVPTERLLAAIDEETLIVPVSHVLFKSSFVQDAKAICDRAREVGALVLLDTYQSLGTVPLDVQALDVDMVCGGSVKWLLGGPGAAYLYVRPELRERLKPKLTGWAAHADPFAFEPGAQRFASDAMALTTGTPAVACLVQACPGYECVLEVGVEAIRRHSIELQEALRTDLIERGFGIFGPQDGEDASLRGGTLTVQLRDDESGSAMVRALGERSILVDHRPGAGIRVSPHFYTEAEELHAFAEHMSDLRETGAWKSLVGSGPGY
ncbi:MAG: aminotransferase class V-fold PLP-dependent enzyme [Planctomycetota bacterium]